MQFRIDPEIFEKYPGLLVGVLVCKGIRNEQSTPEIGIMMAEQSARIRARFPDPEMIKADPVIAAWQEVHRSFGSNPNKFPSSVHALMKRVAKGGELPAINALVDLYNVISLKHTVPVGGEDLDRCSGDIVLTLADGSEPFIALAGAQNDPPDPGEVIYRDDESVLCRKFNWRESARTCLTEKTTNAVLVIEAVPPTTSGDITGTLADLERLTAMYAGGTLRKEILTVASPSTEL